MRRDRSSLSYGATAALALLVLAGCGGGGSDAGAPPADPEGGVTVSIAPVQASGVQGTARLNPAGDSMTVKLELLGVQEGRSYPVTLVRAACDGEGEVVSALDTPHVGTVGVGSSVTRIPAASVTSGGPLSLRVADDAGTVVACGDVGVAAAST